MGVLSNNHKCPKCSQTVSYRIESDLYYCGVCRIYFDWFDGKLIEFDINGEGST